MTLYQRATAIVLEALDLAPADRDAHVARACVDDPALAAEVRSLLAAHARATAFLETPPDTTGIEASLEAGAVVGAYRIIGRLGEGGMGVVYLAEDTRLARTVALKAILPRFTHDDRWRDRLRREARAAAALTHPGVATVFALEEIDGRLYLATEHVPGETLRERLTRGPLPEADVRQIGRQLADALAAAHDRGIVHRDLKPENVMWTATGTVKILDFGLARMEATASVDAPAQLTVDGAVFGTPAYMSPEQLRGEAAGPATDLYALGILLAELATGHHPFGGTNATVTMARSLSTEPNLSGVPASLRLAVATCLAKRVDERFHSAHEVRAALTGTTQPGAAGPRHRAFWWWQFHQGAASLFAVALAVGVWAVHHRVPPPFGTPLMLVALTSALAAATLRLHRWFTVRVYPADAPAQLRRVARWALAADVLEALGVLGVAVQLPSDTAVATALLAASAVVLLLVSLVVEPATTRAAHLS